MWVCVCVGLMNLKGLKGWGISFFCLIVFMIFTTVKQFKIIMATQIFSVFCVLFYFSFLIEFIGVILVKII